MKNSLKAKLSILLAAIMLTVSLVACGGSSSSSTPKVSLTPISGEDFLKAAESLGYAATTLEPSEDDKWTADYFSYDPDDIDFIIDLEEYADEAAAETAMKVWTDDDEGDNVDYTFERNDDRTAAVLSTDDSYSEFLWVGNTILCVTIANTEEHLAKAKEFIDTVGGDYAKINLIK